MVGKVGGVGLVGGVLICFLTMKVKEDFLCVLIILSGKLLIVNVLCNFHCEKLTFNTYKYLHISPKMCNFANDKNKDRLVVVLLIYSLRYLTGLKLLV